MPNIPPDFSAHGSPSSKLKLLFIDDDQSVLASLRTLFDSNYHTYCAASAREGLSMVEQAHPNVIILDLKLPDGTGIDVLREIRKRDAITPVIVLTGYSTKAMAEECVRLGATDYVNKPFDSKMLRERVERCGHSSKILQEKGEYENFVADSLQVLGSFRELQNASAAFIHDVSGPLSCLMAGSDLLAEAIDDKTTIKTEDIGDVVEMMGKGVHYLRELVQQWRAFADLHSLMHGKCGAREAIDFAVSQVMSQVISTGVILQLQTPHEEIQVPGNHFALARVLINLLKNAIEAVGLEQGRVYLSAVKVGDHLKLTISDNGLGVKLEDMPRIFDSGFTTKETGKGMGLFISRKLVEALGGDINVSSPGALSGTDFIVTLPLV